MEMKEALEKLLEEKKNILFRERFKHKHGKLGTLAIIHLLEKHGYHVAILCEGNGTFAYTEQVLAEIFGQSPLPNILKTPKKKFAEGKLERGAITSIIQKYSSYKLHFGAFKAGERVFVNPYGVSM